MTPCTDEKLRPKGQAEGQCPPDKGGPGGWGPTTLASVLELRPHLMGPQESEVGSCIQHRSSPISLGPVRTRVWGRRGTRGQGSKGGAGRRQPRAGGQVAEKRCSVTPGPEGRGDSEIKVSLADCFPPNAKVN